MKFSLNKLSDLLIAPIASLILTLILIFPALPSLTTRFIGDGGDNYEFASYILLFKKNLIEGNSLFGITNFFRFPSGFDFATSFDSYIAVISGGLLNLILPMPLSYNILIISMMTLNGIFSYIFFKYISKSTLLGILGMLIYGFSFYSLSKIEAHLNLLLIGLFPLLAYSIMKIIRESKIGWKEFGLFFATLFLISIESKQYFVFASLFIAIYSMVLFFMYRGIFNNLVLKIIDAKIPLISTGFIFIVAMLTAFEPSLMAIINGKFYLVERDVTLLKTTPSPLDYILPNTYLNTLSNIIKSPTLKSIETVIFLGWIEIILFIFFFFTKRIEFKTKVFVLILFLIPFILSLGYGIQNHFPLLPYRFLGNFLFFKTLVEPGRYFTIFYLVMTSAIIYALSKFDKSKHFTVFICAIFLIILLERFPRSIATASTLNSDYQNIVRQQQSNAVLDLPVNIYYPNYNMLAFYYQKPIVNGYFNWASDGPSEREFLISSGLLNYFTCNPNDNLNEIDREYLINKLRAQGIRTVVVHKDYKFYFTECKNVRVRISSIFPNIMTINPTLNQENFSKNIYTGKPSLEIYFPKAGKFYLDGLYIAPDSKANFNILLNGNALETSYSWNPIGSPNAMEILPKNEIQLDVSQGSVLRIYSDEIVNNTFISVWYRYDSKDSSTLPYNPPIQKIYEDEKEEIYQLN